MKQVDATLLTIEDLKALVYGACFCASGGGGPISMALTFLQKMQQPVPLVSLEQLDHSQLALVPADMGSPDAALKGLGYTAPVNACKTLRAYLQQQHQSVGYLMPIEIGAVNSLIPFYLAEQLGSGLAVIDADPSGRSVPQLNETLLDLSQQAICPAAVASDTHTGSDNSTTSNNSTPPALCRYSGEPYHSELITEPLSATELEDKARQIVSGPEYQQVGGLSCYPLSAEWLATAQSSLVTGSLHKAVKIGHQLLKSTDASQLSATLSANQIEHYLLFRGTLTDIQNHTVGGFDLGKLVFEGATPADGDKAHNVDQGSSGTAKPAFWVYYKNESLIAWDVQQQQPRVLAPDCINLRLVETHGDKTAGSPLSTADIATGQLCEIWGTACAPAMRNSQLVARFQQDIAQLSSQFPELQSYDLGYRTLSDLNATS